jgi:hypothetical protein
MYVHINVSSMCNNYTCSHIVRIGFVSFNQPNISYCANWSSNAITWSSSAITGTTPYGIFISTANTIFVAARIPNRIHIWYEYDTTPNRTVSGGLSKPHSIFVTSNEDIYVDNGIALHRVDKFTSNGTISTAVMSVNSTCYGLFIDQNDTIYCSLRDYHLVMKQSLTNSNLFMVNAGTGVSGAAQDSLSFPYGIFVDAQLKLYVADCGNDRIQVFPFNSTIATTAVSNGTSGTNRLYCPTSITIDGNGFLFIVDSKNNRIIRSKYNMTECIAGCGGVGSSASQLNSPRSLALDSYGNIYVTDWNNNRVQKFILANGYCREYDLNSCMKLRFELPLSLHT